MSLPYRWTAEGAHQVSITKLVVGNLVAFEHEVWRVVALHELDPANIEKGRPSQTVQIRPVGSDSIQTSSSEDLHLSGWKFQVFQTEHYPVCAQCIKPLPCPEVMQQQVTAKALERTRRYEFPGVCPSCEEPVTERQARQTWPDNLVVPNGQPVTFHLRERCVWSATEYDKKWRAAGNESMLGFEPDAEAVEKLLAELDGREDWGRAADTQNMRRYSSLIPPKVNRRPGPCGLRLDGCLGKQTHSGRCNGLTMTGGCEPCMAKWVEDAAAVYDTLRTRSQAAVDAANACRFAHLHLDGELSPGQVRAGLTSVKCGCRRSVMRLHVPNEHTTTEPQDGAA